ncbi:unnamed protein product [Acanthoscelides obtectus]|uniref:Uncharacterized protein n=1 Tax=Acanthoscelides obtectus TaxID=200917 RepID=A0A9P0PT70_ACAOB|nr:unnamed protein product [Acanthoscelides obtectus]CAK1660798.1 hypothetical protein AOBTE_LOCUS22268 [Acanthoscelides obtectus]
MEMDALISMNSSTPWENLAQKTAMMMRTKTSLVTNYYLRMLHVIYRLKILYISCL